MPFRPIELFFFVEQTGEYMEEEPRRTCSLSLWAIPFMQLQG